MELIASLFCHVPEGLPETEVQQELQRQHDMLAQHAAPDEVLLRFLQRAQANDLGLIFVESKEVFPLSQQAHIPCVEVCFVREGVQETLGHDDIQVAEEELQPKNVYMYWGF